MKIPGVKNFRYQEFFSPTYFNKWKTTPSYLINSIDPRLPLLAQFMRDRYGKSVTITNWLWRGEDDYPYDYSGFREHQYTDCSMISRHRLGLCIDTKVAGMEAREVQKDMRDNFDIFSKHGLTSIEEDTPTWTHSSLENTSWRHENGLWIIPNPNKK